MLRRTSFVFEQVLKFRVFTPNHNNIGQILCRIPVKIG